VGNIQSNFFDFEKKLQPFQKNVGFQQMEVVHPQTTDYGQKISLITHTNKYPEESDIFGSCYGPGYSFGSSQFSFPVQNFVFYFRFGSGSDRSQAMSGLYCFNLKFN